MSSLEVGKAFNAPIMQGHDSNATVAELLGEVRGSGVRYAAFAVDERTHVEGQLFEYGAAKYPRQGFAGDVPDSRMRVEMSSTRQQVSEPKKEWTFVG